MRFIETHAHIYSDQFKEDRSECIERAKRIGVEKMYMPNVDSQSIDAMLHLEECYPGYCIPMMGIHPCSINAEFEKELSVVEEWLNKRSFVAIGEIGMDLYWDKTYQAQQKEALKIQAKWAMERDIPIVIHAREANQEILAVLESMNNERLQGVFHCFSGTENDAQRIIDLGFFIGIGGVVTFKNGGLDKVIPHIPLEKIVLETDCPYLSPVPHRGKRNETSYLPLIAQKIGDIKACSVAEVARITSENADKLFNV